jgi:hypothetical protein
MHCSVLAQFVAPVDVRGLLYKAYISSQHVYRCARKEDEGGGGGGKREICQ